MRLVDLSHPLATGMTTYPGDPAVEVSPALELARDGCAVAALRLGTHSGTHVDAPSHVVPGGASIDQLDLALFAGPAVVVDVRGARPRQRIGWEPFAAHAGSFGPGVVVLVRTGWDALFDDADAYPDQPWLAPEVAERLVGRGCARSASTRSARTRPGPRTSACTGRCSARRRRRREPARPRGGALGAGRPPVGEPAAAAGRRR